MHGQSEFVDLCAGGVLAGVARGFALVRHADGLAPTKGRGNFHPTGQPDQGQEDYLLTLWGAGRERARGDGLGKARSHRDG